VLEQSILNLVEENEINDVVKKKGCERDGIKSLKNEKIKLIMKKISFLYKLGRTIPPCFLLIKIISYGQKMS
jgi:hypothetical protein